MLNSPLHVPACLHSARHQRHHAGPRSTVFCCKNSIAQGLLCGCSSQRRAGRSAVSVLLNTHSVLVVGGTDSSRQTDSGVQTTEMRDPGVWLWRESRQPHEKCCARALRRKSWPVRRLVVTSAVSRAVSSALYHASRHDLPANLSCSQRAARLIQIRTCFEKMKLTRCNHVVQFSNTRSYWYGAPLLAV